MTIDKEKIYACWLDSLFWFHRKTKHLLLQTIGSAEEIYNVIDSSAKNSIIALIGIKEYEKLKEYKQKQLAQHQTPQLIWEKQENLGIKYTYYNASDFPHKLKSIPDPPFGIFYKGELPDKKRPAVAMIGARKCSEYGRCMAESIAAGLALKGIAVISGMAMGIDGISQRAALSAGGKSYGVLGCGVDVIYPASNARLYEKLVEKGGVLSEYPPAMEPRSALFPPRNRIISALSDIVLVVEAREKSGTFITVDMALEQGREVYAVPGRCTDGLSVGCNRLLRQGAGAVMSAEDIINDMGWNMALKEQEHQPQIALSQTAKEIYKVLEPLPISQDVIISLLRENGCCENASKICQGFLELELKKVAVRTNGGYQLVPAQSKLLF